MRGSLYLRLGQLRVYVVSTLRVLGVYVVSTWRTWCLLGVYVVCTWCVLRVYVVCTLRKSCFPRHYVVFRVYMVY